MENSRITAEKILCGSFDKLPKIPARTIRVFFSSTFTDMTEDRNVLMNKSIPEVRKYCKEKGFDFEVVDMRWGVREDAYADHMTTDICLKEIENCQLISAGPNFVIFIGDKYGTRPLPNAICVSEFRLFRRLASWMELKFETVEKWYLLDSNSVPPSYYIQPITKLLPYYNDMDPANERNRIIHQNSWESEERNMKRILRKLAQAALEQKKISKHDYDKYFVSVTENEIEKGIFLYPKVKDRVLYFHRTLTDINLEHPKAKRFIDLRDDGKIDEEAKELHQILQCNSLPASVPECQTVKFTVPWTHEGISPDYQSHKKYLFNLCESFETLMKKQIDKCVQRAVEQKIANKNVAEALVHLQFCVQKCQCFFGQEEIISSIFNLMQFSHSNVVPEDVFQHNSGESESYENDKSQRMTAFQEALNKKDKHSGPTLGIGDVDYDVNFDPTRNIKQHLISFNMTGAVKQPIIIYGESGCGKTSLMAQLALTVKTRLTSSIVIIRFLGITVQSSNVRSLLISLMNNIWGAYKINRPADLDLNSDIIFLGHYLQALIWKVASPEHPLYIFLDSLDQLSHIEQAHRLAWLPSILPENAYIIVSTLNNESGCLQSARQRFPISDQFFEVKSLRIEAADKVITAILNQKSRALTRIQRNFLIEQFKKCPTPMFLRMLIDQALKWRSHQDVKDIILASDTNFAINHVFLDLEKEHGRIIISKALGYFTSMKQGASMQEMEDILSLDDEVLQNTYIYHLPPSSDFIRLPPSLWGRIMMDIKEYMTGDSGHGKLILTWYHRLFKQIAAERYLNDKNRFSIHKIVAEYFLGYWHNKLKPLELYKGKTGWFPSCMRGIPEQPLMYADGSLNKRKLKELPYHLALAGMWRKFHEEIICSVEWLIAKVNAFGVSDLRADLMFMLSQREFLKEEDSTHENITNHINGKLDGTEFADTGTDNNNSTKEDEKENKYKAEFVDLKTALKDLETLIAIVNMGVDSIRHNSYNLPVQVICQLGKHPSTSDGLKKLVADSFKWIENNKTPMLLPEDMCMTAPGGKLLTTLNVDVHLLGEDRTHDFPVLHIKEENHLYVIQQSSRQKDTFIVLDLNQSGERVLAEEANGYVHSIKSNADEKFLIVCFYKKLGKYDFKLFSQLYKRSNLSQYITEHEATCIDVSANGELVAYTHDNICNICSPNNEKLTLTLLHQLKLQEDICNILFSYDSHYLVTFISYDGFITWLPLEGISVFSTDRSKKEKLFTRNLSGQKVYITFSNKLLQVKSGYSERNMLDVFDLVTGALLYKLQTSELNYKIDFLELDEKEELVLVSSEEEVISNGNFKKSAVLWEINTGKLMSVVACRSPISATKITVINNEIFIFVAQVRDPTVYVYNGGYRHNPLEKAELVQHIQGHTKDIIQILLSATDGQRLITVSADNSIKIWDLQQIITSTIKEESIDIGASVHLIYNKDGSKVYFVTDKGFIIKQCMLTGTKATIDSVLIKAAHILLLSKDGKYLMAAIKNTIHVYLAETGKKEFILNSCGSSDISCLAENGHVLLAGHAGMTGSGRFWNLTNGTIIKDTSFLYSFYKVAISPCGTKFGLTFFEYPLAMNIQSEDDIDGPNINMEQIDTMMSSCSCLSFSPDAKMLIATSSDGRVRIVDSNSGRYLHTMFQRSSITTMLITSDSRLLLTGGYRTVYIWNIGTSHPFEQQGQLLVKLTPHENFITCMQLVRGDSHLVTASLDKTIAIWSLSTRTTICTFRYHCSIDIMEAAPDLSTISFIPERSPIIGEVKLNKAGREALNSVPSVTVTEELINAQAVALTFSSQQFNDKLPSATCSAI